VGWPLIGKDQPGVIVHGIGAVAEPVLQGAAGRLAGGLEDRAVDIEEPAVIAAADALVADQAELERGAAMRAMQFEETDGAGFVAERNEVLAENAQAPRDLAQFAGKDDRLPKAPQIEAVDRGIRLTDAGGWFDGEYRETWPAYSVARYLAPNATGNGTREERDRLLADAEIILGGWPFPLDLRSRAPRLKWFHQRP